MERFLEHGNFASLYCQQWKVGYTETGKGEIMKRNHLNSLALLTVEKRQLGQEEGEWDTFPFPLKQPLNNWGAVHWEV